MRSMNIVAISDVDANVTVSSEEYEVARNQVFRRDRHSHMRLHSCYSREVNSQLSIDVVSQPTAVEPVGASCSPGVRFSKVLERKRDDHRGGFLGVFSRDVRDIVLLDTYATRHQGLNIDFCRCVGIYPQVSDSKFIQDKILWFDIGLHAYPLTAF